MNITKIERYFRVLALPIGCMVMGVFLIMIGAVAKDAILLAGIAFYIAMGGLFIAAFGVLWTLWSLMQMDRWEQGTLIGSCKQCGGIERNLDGKHGPYSVCQMCGAKREGW